MTVAPVAGTTKMRIVVRGVSAATSDQAKTQAWERVAGLIPKEGYLLSEPEAVYEPDEDAARPKEMETATA